MKLHHKHLLLRAEVRKPFVDEGVAAQWLRRLVEAIGMKIASGPHVAYVRKPGNEGITSCVLIETSHIALHIWDKADPPLAQLDVYSCSEFAPEQILPFLDDMDPVKVDCKFLDRESGFSELS